MKTKLCTETFQICLVFTLEESRENEPCGPTSRPTNLRGFLHDVTFAILVFQNIKMEAMLVFQTNSVGVELIWNLRTTTKFTTTTSVDWEKTGTRTSVSAGKRKLKTQSVGRSTTTTLNRKLKQLRRLPQRRLQKNNRFNYQNNNSARASRFLIHFFDVHCTTTT